MYYEVNLKSGKVEHIKTVCNRVKWHLAPKNARQIKIDDKVFFKDRWSAYSFGFAVSHYKGMINAWDTPKMEYYRNQL